MSPATAPLPLPPGTPPPVLSSAGLGWGGVTVKQMSVPGETVGVLEYGPSPAHSLLLPLRPVRLEQSRGGRSEAGIVGPGAAILARAGEPSRWRWHGSLDALCVHLEPSLVARVAGEPGATDIGDAFGADDPVAARLAHLLLDEARRGDGGSDGGRLYAESLGVALAAHLLRAYPAAGRTAHGVTPAPGGLAPRDLDRAVGYIRAHLGDPGLSLASVAAAVGISPYHFARQFRRSAGLPPHQFVLRERVEEAARLLRSGDAASVTEAALRSGFAHPSHLAAHFRRAYGVSPRDYARGALQPSARTRSSAARI